MADLDYFSLSESTLKELAGQGDAEAMIALGIGYYFGSFGEKDVSSAFDFLAEAYRKGDVKAAPFLAEMIYFRQVSTMRIIAAGHMNSIRKGRRSG